MINRLLAQLKEEKTQINRIREEQRNVTKDNKRNPEQCKEILYKPLLY